MGVEGEDVVRMRWMGGEGENVVDVVRVRMW